MNSGRTRVGKNYWAGLGIIFLAGLGLRLLAVPPFGFFCDVPSQIAAIESKRFFVQFPGYVPFHLLVATLAGTGLSTFGAMWLFSLVCAEASFFYVVLAARKAAGEGFSLLAGLVMACGVFPVYFSMVGASYTTDMLCVSGMLFHGWEFLRSRRPAHYYLVVAWLCFGFLMRPLSAVWTIFGLAFLFSTRPSWRTFFLSALLLGTAAAFFLALSVPCYGSFSAWLKSAAGPASALAGVEWRSRLTNLVRAIGYPVYGFHLWLGFTAWAAMKHWRTRNRPEFLYLVLVVGPYCLLLQRYIAHAGYYCLVIPALVLLPACFFQPVPMFRGRKLACLGATFLTVSLCQWYVLRPVASTSVAACVADAYFLQYSHAGLKAGMFEILSSIMHKNNVRTQRIPKGSLDNVKSKLPDQKARPVNSAASENTRPNPRSAPAASADSAAHP